MAPWRVVLLPGIVLPVEIAYADLLAELGHGIDGLAKDLEIYATPTPPADYSLDLEIDGVLRAAKDRGWDRFHLLGYSAGGASALAFAAKHRQELESLTLLEPAWAGNWGDVSDAHRRLWLEYERLEQCPPNEVMHQLMRLQVRPDVVLPAPPVGEQPPWMAQRPAGIRALLQTFRTYDLDRVSLTKFRQPVYYGLGGLSNPDQFAEPAERLAGVFPNLTVEVFPQRHHFDPPHRAEPAHLAASLREVWS